MAKKKNWVIVIFSILILIGLVLILNFKYKLPLQPKEADFSGWHIYRNVDYGFELAYPAENWKECEPKGNTLFHLTGKNQKCEVGPNDEPNDRIIVSLSSILLRNYKNYEELKVAFEKAMNSSEKSIKVEGVELFEVHKIEETIFGGKKALIVSEFYPFGLGGIGIYVFHKENLFIISYFDVAENRGIGKNKEILQILSTFKFLE